jgi:hypothetical protein
LLAAEKDSREIPAWQSLLTFDHRLLDTLMTMTKKHGLKNRHNESLLLVWRYVSRADIHWTCQLGLQAKRSLARYEMNPFEVIWMEWPRNMTAIFRIRAKNDMLIEDHSGESELWQILTDSVSSSPWIAIQVPVDLSSADRTAKIDDRPYITFRVYHVVYRSDEVSTSYLVRPMRWAYRRLLSIWSQAFYFTRGIRKDWNWCLWSEWFIDDPAFPENCFSTQSQHPKFRLRPQFLSLGRASSYFLQLKVQLL